MIVNNKRVNKVKVGDGFGELALLHDTRRSATIRALERSTMWGVERTTFRKVIEEMNTQNYNENRQFIESVALLQPLTEQQKDSIAAALITKKYSRDEYIVTEGEDGDRLYIIKEGTVQVKRGGKEIRKMHRGAFFGELALLNNSKRTATIIAWEGEVKCVIMMRDTLNKILGNQL